MKTIFSGPVTDAMVAASGFKPTLFVTNEQTRLPPCGKRLEGLSWSICKLLEPEAAVRQRDWTLVEGAQCLILAGRNDHLYELAKRYGLHIYAPDYHAGTLVGDQKNGWVNEDRPLEDYKARRVKKEEPDLFSDPAPVVDLFGAQGGETDLFAA